MRSKFDLILAALLIVLAFNLQATEQLGAPAKAPTKIVGYLHDHGQKRQIVSALGLLQQERPDLAEYVEIRFLTDEYHDKVTATQIEDLDVLVIDLGIINQQVTQLVLTSKNTDLVIIVVGENEPPQALLTLNLIDSPRARAFWRETGSANQLGLLKLALGAVGIESLSVPEPEVGLKFGYYYPGDGASSKGSVFSSWDDFTAYRHKHQKSKAGAPRIAVGFYSAFFYGRETEIVDAVIAQIEAVGAEAVPYFGYPGHIASERLLLDEDGKARADSILAFNFRFGSPDASKHLTRLNIPIINLITLYGRSEQQWRASDTGLSMFEGTFQIMGPELGGLLAPTVVGSQEPTIDPATGLSIEARTPIADQIDRAVARALAWARLQGTDNKNKKLALIYYNYPAGKANIGASYLNVAESISIVLKNLKQQGYDIGDQPLDTDSILARLVDEAINVGGYAPGELEKMVSAGDAVKVPLEQYQSWLSDLHPELGAKVVADWGQPQDSQLMAIKEDDQLSFIIPVVGFGNVTLLPQPARGWGEDNVQLYHADDLAPHHQYIATYEWLKRGYKADAVVHIGTHGTLEWLDGKATGLSAEDAPEALIGALPNLYIYNVDVVGEGLVARRRGAAALLDHMVPPFVAGGMYADLAKLSELVNSYHNNLHKNPELAEVYAEDIRLLIMDLGIDKDLDLQLVSIAEARKRGLDVGLAVDHRHGGTGGAHSQHDTEHQHKPNELEHSHRGAAEHEHLAEFSSAESVQFINHDLLHVIQDYLVELRSQNIPYGLHAFGRTPQDDHIKSTVSAIVDTDRSLIGDSQQRLSIDVEQSIRGSGPQEIASLLNGLEGAYLAGGNGGDPIRNPDVYPTGKNFYGVDPDKVPTEAAYKLGVVLADSMLADHVDQYGEYPDKVSFVIWGNETLRHEGILESQIFHLLGTRPVWNDRGKLVDVEVIPKSVLGRPRVDIVIASAAEGMFHNLTMMIDRAVQKVKAIDELDNYVRQHYLQTKSALIDFGYSEQEADQLAGVRIFDEPPGIHNLNTSRIVEASGTWDSDIGIAHDYIKKMGHGFGNGFWGEPMEDVFRLTLAGADKVVHSSSTNLYGTLDNDDFYMYAGGLVNAIGSIDGEQPELVVTNTRNPENPEMTDIDKFIGQEMRSRYLNPKWIEGMQKEGYAGAGEMRAFVEYLWGWDATVSTTVNDAMWQQTFEVYIEDKYAMDLAAFFDQESPFALQDISARMLEVIRKDYWQPDDATVKTLLETYLQSVEKHGVGCSDVSCGNARLLEHIVIESQRLGLPAELVQHFKQEVEQLLKAEIKTLARELEQFAQTNEARISARKQMLEQGIQPETVTGYVMEDIEQNPPQTSAEEPDQGSNTRSFLVFALLLIIGLLFWRSQAPRRSKADI